VRSVIEIDLESAPDRARLHALMGGADVLIDGYTEGVLARHGFGEEEVSAKYPDLVRVRVSCYGHVGPLRAAKGFQQNANFATGVATVADEANLGCARTAAAHSRHTRSHRATSTLRECHVAPRRTAPCAAAPCAAAPCAAAPCAAAPCAALPCAALPCAALPCAALPCAALPCAALPCAALQTSSSARLAYATGYLGALGAVLALTDRQQLALADEQRATAESSTDGADAQPASAPEGGTRRGAVVRASLCQTATWMGKFGVRTADRTRGLPVAGSL
jgi:hypothetical protein